MDRRETAAALLADVDQLLERAREGFREVVPELDGFPPDVTEQLVRATKFTVQAFARYLRNGSVRAADRLRMRAETHMGQSSDPLLDDEQVRSLTLAMLAALRTAAPTGPELRDWWMDFLAESLQPERTVPELNYDEALAALEAEGADFG